MRKLKKVKKKFVESSKPELKFTGNLKDMWWIFKGNIRRFTRACYKFK